MMLLAQRAPSSVYLAQKSVHRGDNRPAGSLAPKCS